MTPNQILQSSLLEIIFDNRNKQYGAYALRKFYPRRLGKALVLTLGSVFLLLLVLSNLQPTGMTPPLLDNKPDVVISLPPAEASPATPEPPRAPASRRAATIPYTGFQIVPPEEVVTPSPTTEELETGNIGSTSTSGDGPATLGVLPSAEGPGGTGTAGPEPSTATAAPGISRAPEFPGGLSAWTAFLSRYLQVPEELEAGERKTVMVRFWVSADGGITDFQVLQSAGPAFDKEVVRVLKKMPRWKPALQNGVPVATGFTQPVTFTAVEE